MSSIRTTPVLAILTLSGAVVGIAGVGVASLGHHLSLGICLCLIGGAIELTGPTLHDRQHRQRGEVTHAMWGTADMNKPSWWPTKTR